MFTEKNNIVLLLITFKLTLKLVESCWMYDEMVIKRCAYEDCFSHMKVKFLFCSKIFEPNFILTLKFHLFFLKKNPKYFPNSLKRYKILTLLKTFMIYVEN